MKEQLSRFENRIGSTLPIEYVNFLVDKKTKLLPPVVIEFIGVDGHPNSTAVRSMFALTNDELEKNYIFYVESCRIEKGYVPFAEDVGGNVLCIGVNSTNHGKVYFWDHEFEFLDEFKETHNLALVSNSFNEFIAARDNGNS